MNQADGRLEACDVSVAYHQKQNHFLGLKKTSLTFNSSEITAIVGPSGAGKSTLIKALLGIVPLNSGQVLFGQKTLASSDDGSTHNFSSSRRQVRSGVCWLAQDLYLSFNSSVLTNVCCGELHRLGLAETFYRGFSQQTKDKAYALLCSLGVGDKVHEKVKNLSGGQRQRVALARALMQDSSWILADEPFSALDENFKEVALKVVLERHQSGVGLLMVVHDLEIAQKIAQRIIGIRDGEVIFDGSAKDFDTNTRMFLFRGMEGA